MDHTTPPPDLKRCARCKEYKPRSVFGPLPRSRDGLNSYCRPCGAAIKAAWNRTERGQRTMAAKLERERPAQLAKLQANKTAIRDYLTQYKREHGCAFCNEREPVCLDFHHRDPSQKTITISRIQNEKKTWKPLAAELLKCVLVCANCHRKIHAGLLSLPESPVQE